MRVTFLGTGTSVGIPAIGCGCAVCRSDDPRNKRRRSSIYVEGAGVAVQVDMTPDFREQALANRMPRIDAVVFTHSHADHIFGFDDIRRYNALQGERIPAYGTPGTLADLKRIFSYFIAPAESGVYRPLIDFVELTGPVAIGGMTITAFPVDHGGHETHGLHFEADGKRLGYAPDCVNLSDEAVGLLRGVDVMILDALRHRPHRTHLTVAASLALLRRIEAPRAYLIHMCHDLDHEATERDLPAAVRLSYDGLAVEV